MLTTLYMLQEQSSIQMMSYVIKTKEGKLIVIDGGNKADAHHLLETLIRLGGPQPYIDLWILTHPHSDHLDALLEIFSKPNPLKVKKICSHFLSRDFYIHNRLDGHIDEETLDAFEKFKEKNPQLCYELQKGDKFFVGSVELSVLHVPDGTITVDRINNSSIVFRIDVEGQRLLFLGDLAEESGEIVLERVPHEELRSSFVQMAHHGQNGVNKKFYEVVAPKACLWNTPDWLWDNNVGTGYNKGPFKTIEVQKWMEELGVDYHFITKDKEHVIPLPYPLD